MRRLFSKFVSRELINYDRVSPPGYPVAVAIAYISVALFIFCIVPASLR